MVKIKAGYFYLCLKDIGGYDSFTKGKIYSSLYDNALINDNHIEVKIVNSEYFRIATDEEIKAQKGELNMKTGIELIAEERQRQIEVEGWTKEHDAEHKNGELAKAAICYADPNIYYHQENRIMRYRIPNKFWPKQWDIHWFKPTDRIRDLVKAGALIAAEIDRLQAKKGE